MNITALQFESVKEFVYTSRAVDKINSLDGSSVKTPNDIEKIKSSCCEIFKKIKSNALETCIEKGLSKLQAEIESKKFQEQIGRNISVLKETTVKLFNVMISISYSPKKSSEPVDIIKDLIITRDAGRVQKAKELIEKHKIDLNKTDIEFGKEGRHSLLWIACACGDLEMVDFFLSTIHLKNLLDYFLSKINSIKMESNEEIPLSMILDTMSLNEDNVIKGVEILNNLSRLEARLQVQPNPLQLNTYFKNMLFALIREKDILKLTRVVSILVETKCYKAEDFFSARQKDPITGEALSLLEALCLTECLPEDEGTKREIDTIIQLLIRESRDYSLGLMDWKAGYKIGEIHRRCCEACPHDSLSHIVARKPLEYIRDIISDQPSKSKEDSIKKAQKVRELIEKYNIDINEFIKIDSFSEHRVGEGYIKQSKKLYDLSGRGGGGIRCSLLLIACFNHEYDVVRCLLDKNANLNQVIEDSNITALHGVIDHSVPLEKIDEMIGAIKLLFDYGGRLDPADQKLATIIFAARKHNIEVIIKITKAFLENTPIEARRFFKKFSEGWVMIMLLHRVYRACDVVPNRFYDDVYGSTTQAVEIMKLLVDNNAFDLNFFFSIFVEKSSALGFNFMNSHFEWLMNTMCKVLTWDKVKEIYNLFDKNGCTLLEKAYASKNFGIVQFLVESGVAAITDFDFLQVEERRLYKRLLKARSKIPNDSNLKTHEAKIRRIEEKLQNNREQMEKITNEEKKLLNKIVTFQESKKGKTFEQLKEIDENIEQCETQLNRDISKKLKLISFQVSPLYCSWVTELLQKELIKRRKNPPSFRTAIKHLSSFRISE